MSLIQIRGELQSSDPSHTTRSSSPGSCYLATTPPSTQNGERGNRTLGNAAGGKTERRLGGSFKGRNCWEGKLSPPIWGKMPQCSCSPAEGQSLRATPHPCPSPSQNSRPGFPTCRLLRPREGRGRKDGTGLEPDSGQRLGGGGAGWKGEEASSLAIVPGHVHW